jgi:hypothetical protein
MRGRPLHPARQFLTAAGVRSPDERSGIRDLILPLNPHIAALMRATRLLVGESAILTISLVFISDYWRAFDCAAVEAIVARVTRNGVLRLRLIRRSS